MVERCKILAPLENPSQSLGATEQVGMGYVWDGQVKMGHGMNKEGILLLWRGLDRPQPLTGH